MDSVVSLRISLLVLLLAVVIVIVAPQNSQALPLSSRIDSSGSDSDRFYRYREVPEGADVEPFSDVGKGPNGESSRSSRTLFHPFSRTPFISNRPSTQSYQSRHFQERISNSIPNSFVFPLPGTDEPQNISGVSKSNQIHFPSESSSFTSGFGGGGLKPVANIKLAESRYAYGNDKTRIQFPESHEARMRSRVESRPERTRLFKNENSFLFPENGVGRLAEEFIDWVNSVNALSKGSDVPRSKEASEAEDWDN